MENLKKFRENLRLNSLTEVHEKFKDFWKNLGYNEKSIKFGAAVFVAFLYLLIFKYLLYDIGFSLATIFLVTGQAALQIYFSDRQRVQEASSLVLFIFFDKDIVEFGNVLLLLGVWCIREVLHKDIVLKEAVSFLCGLIFLLMGWSSVGRIFIIRFLVTVLISVVA